MLQNTYRASFSRFEPNIKNLLEIRVIAAIARVFFRFFLTLGAGSWLVSPHFPYVITLSTEIAAFANSMLASQFPPSSPRYSAVTHAGKLFNSSVNRTKVGSL